MENTKYTHTAIQKKVLDEARAMLKDNPLAPKLRDLVTEAVRYYLDNMSIPLPKRDKKR